MSPAAVTPPARWDRWEPVVRLLLVVGGAALLLAATRSGVLFSAHSGAAAGHPLSWLLACGTLLFLTSLVWRTWRWFGYRPQPLPPPGREWPELAVIVPAYNEGASVERTLDAIAANDYPPRRLRIIAVDDGSRDDTHDHLLAAAARHRGRIEVIRFMANRGKRQALYEGMLRSDAPYLVTIDSDTQLEPTALREIVAPLLARPELGAVTGRIRVLNWNANFLTRMLNANFAMAFDFTRAVESTFDAVFCTSGAFSAYRGELVRRVAERWRTQTFLGRPCTYGEDRSLANYLLRLGAGTAFQRTAIARTLVPETAGRMMKMLTRWARSNIRESIVFCTFAAAPSRRGNRLWPLLEFVATAGLFLLHFVWFYGMLAGGGLDLTAFLRSSASAALIGFVYMLYYMRIDGRGQVPYVLAFCLLCAPLMVGIFTVAAMTLTTRRWSTR